MGTRDAGKLKEKLCRLFKSEGLDITCQVNVTRTDFLDIEFDLETASYKPFRKKNDQTIYINAQSNHPPTVIKMLPKMIQKRISVLSDTKETFENEAPFYQNILRQCGYSNVKLEYDPPVPSIPKQRRRNIIYFNPPWNNAVRTDVGKLFLELLDHHFPRGHHLHKFINRHNTKVSYRTTKNMKSYVAAHNRKVLSPKENITKKCNCRTYESRLKARNKGLEQPLDMPPPDWFPRACPVNGECLTKSVIYAANVVSNNSSMEYIGLTGDTFKTRFNGHTDTFRHRDGKMSTLSSHIWELEDKKVRHRAQWDKLCKEKKVQNKKYVPDKNLNYEINWQIKKKAMLYKPGASFCDLCASEKVAILLANPKTSLNKRTEILERCRHRRRFKLGFIET